jgi:hypothetical protein
MQSNESDSQRAHLLKAKIRRPILRGRADDDVIEQFDLQQLGGFAQSSGQALIGLARRRIA